MNPAPRNSIVLVDDEESYTDLMSQLLADNLDCTVHAFTKPLDALEAVAALSPGVIVTDYNMPGIDGLEFIRRATPLAPSAAFILISGQNLAAKEHQIARLSRLKGVVTKPVGWKCLSGEIRRVWPAGSPAPALRPEASSA